MPTLRATENEVILVAGVDAAMYMRVFKFGAHMPHARQVPWCKLRLNTGPTLAIVSAYI